MADGGEDREYHCMSEWNSVWSASSKPGKQRKFVYNAPLHIRTTLLGSHLAKDLRQKLKKRSLRVRKGDKVKVLRGQYRGKSGVVERVDVQKMHVYVTGVDFQKKDGSRALYPVHPSKVMITELEGSEKRRLEAPKVQGSVKK